MRKKMPTNRVLHFDAMEWFERKEHGLHAHTFEFSAPAKFSEKGVEDDYPTDHDETMGYWLVYIAACIADENKNGYRVAHFMKDHGPVDESGPCGRNIPERGKFDCHVEHHVIVVLERDVTPTRTRRARRRA